jgi:hypothetical protein
MPKPIIVLFLVTLLSACTGKQKPAVEPALAAHGLSSIRYNKDGLIVDPKVIVSNKNLLYFINDLKKSQLYTSSKIDGIPPFITSFLKQLSGGSFTIANPGKDWNCCCERNDNLPDRKLIFQAKSKSLFLLTYLTGGFGTAAHVLLISHQNEIITDCWIGGIPQGLNDKNSVVNYLAKNQIQHYDMVKYIVP